MSALVWRIFFSRTSGLSSKDSENVLDLLRELSFKGKLIFVVIHQPSSDVYKMFDKIILLDTGGYQVFYGNPVEAVSYFKKIDNQVNSEAGECTFCGTVNPETMFNVIESKEVVLSVKINHGKKEFGTMSPDTIILLYRPFSKSLKKSIWALDT